MCDTLVDLAQGLHRFTRLASRTDLREPWRTPNVELLDGQTFETWIRHTLRTPTGRAYFRVAFEAVFSADATEMSLLHALFYAHSGTDLETLISTDAGAQQDRVVGGSMLIADRLAARLGERVVRGEPVRAVAQTDAGVVATSRTGRAFEGTQVVVALPPTLAGRLDYDPVLPSWRDQLTQRLPAGSVIKLYAVYDEPFWRADGLNCQVAPDRGPVKVTYDNSRPSGSPGILMGHGSRRRARVGAALPGRTTRGRDRLHGGSGALRGGRRRRDPAGGRGVTAARAPAMAALTWGPMASSLLLRQPR